MPYRTASGNVCNPICPGGPARSAARRWTTAGACMPCAGCCALGAAWREAGRAEPDCACWMIEAHPTIKVHSQAAGAPGGQQARARTQGDCMPSCIGARMPKADRSGGYGPRGRRRTVLTPRLGAEAGDRGVTRATGHHRGAGDDGRGAGDRAALPDHTGLCRGAPSLGGRAPAAGWAAVGT